MRNLLNSLQFSFSAFTAQFPEIMRDVAGFLHSEINTNALTKYSNSDPNLHHKFSISVETSSAKPAAELISETIEAFECVIKNEEKPVKVVVDAFNSDKVKLLVGFWIDTKTFSGAQPDKNYEIMQTVFDKLEKKGIRFSW